MPIRRRAKHFGLGGGRDESERLDYPTIIRIEPSHQIAIQYVDDTLLSAGNEFVGIRTGLVGQDHSASGTQIKIVGIQICHVRGSEIIREREIRGKLENTVAIGLPAIRDIIAMGATFGRLGIDVAVVIGGETDAGLPDRRNAVIGRGIEYSKLRQARLVVGKYPPAVAVIAAVRTKSQVKSAIHQQQAWTIFLMEAVEYGGMSFDAGALGGNQDGTAGLFIAGSDVESVEMMSNSGSQNRLSHQIHRVIGRIDDWSAHDSFLREPERGAAR